MTFLSDWEYKKCQLFKCWDKIKDFESFNYKNTHEKKIIIK